MNATHPESALQKQRENRFAWLGPATFGAMCLSAYAVESVARVMENVLDRVGFLDHMPGPTELAFGALLADVHWIAAGVFTAALLACWAGVRAYFVHACAVIAVLTVTCAAAATFAISMPLFKLCSPMVPQWPDALLRPTTPNAAEMAKLGARVGECGPV